jgi:hypothetical protein
LRRYIAWALGRLLLRALLLSGLLGTLLLGRLLSALLLCLLRTLLFRCLLRTLLFRCLLRALLLLRLLRTLLFRCLLRALLLRLLRLQRFCAQAHLLKRGIGQIARRIGRRRRDEKNRQPQIFLFDHLGKLQVRFYVLLT